MAGAPERKICIIIIAHNETAAGGSGKHKKENCYGGGKQTCLEQDIK